MMKLMWSSVIFLNQMRLKFMLLQITIVFLFHGMPALNHRLTQSGCLAGSPGCPQARNKEEILYKIMTGDTTNLMTDEHEWYFHTPNPGTDLGTELNPHFDSLEGLKEEPAFLREPDGLDCVLILSCGPFDLPVGREVPFSFCIIFGQNEEDLINNAKFAQVMYNSRYQGFTPPTRPTVHAVTEQGKMRRLACLLVFLDRKLF